MKTNPWPLDFDRLAKGDRIDADEIERICGLRRTDEKYRLALLKLRQQIADAMEERGLVVTVKIEGADLHVLVDEEASHHNPRIYEQGLQMAKNAYRRNAGVDLNLLSDGRRPMHERLLIVHGRMLQAAGDARKEALKLTAVERKTPGRLS